MGSRAWCLEVKDKEQAQALQKWYANVERDNSEDYLLTFHYVCKRKDGSVWALFESDGSRCSKYLSRYGFNGRIALKFEFKDWDAESGKLGSIKDATYSAYMDAEPHEFFGIDSDEIISQCGIDAIVKIESNDELIRVKRLIGSIKRLENKRLMPEIGVQIYSIENGVATFFGIMVQRLTNSTYQVLESMAENEVEVFLGKTEDLDLKHGFSIPGEAHLWSQRLEDYVIFPTSEPSESEAKSISERNKGTEELAKVRSVLLGDGYFKSGTGGSSSRRSVMFLKKIQSTSIGYQDDWGIYLHATYVQTEGSSEISIYVKFEMYSNNETHGHIEVRSELINPTGFESKYRDIILSLVSQYKNQIALIESNKMQ
jgi:hypothetical protein